MRYTIVAATALFVFLPQTQIAAQTRIVDKTVPASAFVEFGWQFFKSNRNSVLKHWMEKYQNDNSGLTGEWHTELHSGFRFEFIRGDRYKSDELGSVVIADPTIKLPRGISIGDSKKRIVKTIGEPSSSNVYFGEMFDEYEVNGDAYFVRFHFSHDRLIEVEIGYEHE